jgi:hypothetical protein
MPALINSAVNNNEESLLSEEESLLSKEQSQCISDAVRSQAVDLANECALLVLVS